MKLPFLRRTGPGNRLTLADRLRQLALLGLVALFCLYLAGATAGYFWLHEGRKVEQVGFFDVAFLRVRAVRRAIAVQQFAKAEAELKEKNYQAAYVAYFSALVQDPDNIPGRLAAAGFLRAVGAAALAQNMLEEGLARAPEERRLIEPVFDLLLSTGLDRHALELLHKLYPSGLAGTHALLLQTYELQATLTADGPQPAKQLLSRYPGLVNHPAAAPVIARVYWESAERLKAIKLQQEYIRSQPATYPDYVRLAGWQTAAGDAEAAIKTAQLAVAKFPADLPPRVLLIDTRAAAAPDGRPQLGDVEAYLRNYASRPEAMLLLAQLAGNRGWVDLARILYEIGVPRQGNLPLLALAYSDALMTKARFNEARALLAEVEAQAPEGNLNFAIQLRQRQIIAAAAVGDTANVREQARRLGSALGNHPDGLEVCRRLFLKLGIPDAVDELTPRTGKARPVVPAKKK
jgi:tetratricopeptide (TPR) repeat protein